MLLDDSLFAFGNTKTGLGVRSKRELFIIFIITAVFASYRIILIVLFRIGGFVL